MTVSPLQHIALSELSGLANNPRKIDKQGLNTLCDSIRTNGFYTHRPIAAEQTANGLVVLDGNQRLKACKMMKMRTAPVVVYSDLTDEERTEIIMRGNINNGTWDVPALTEGDFASVDFADMGLDIEQLQLDWESKQPKKRKKAERDTQDEPEADPEETEEIEPENKSDFYARMLGDYLYDSDNKYEIPNLLTNKQPVHLELPFTCWGRDSRNQHNITTYHFYTEDYRFEALWKNPIKLLMSGCKQIVEPNCSIHDQTPVAMALWQIYKKRYLARYFQECGVQVWVDLNVSPKFALYNRLGVPDGYNAFFTRGSDGFMEKLQSELEMARRISGCDRPNMCCYAGGKEVQDWCDANNVLYISNFMGDKVTPLEP